MVLDTKVLRRMWRFVETSNPYSIVKLSDREIAENLIRQVSGTSSLSLEETKVLNNYIAARTPLIRDLAQSKLVLN